MRNSRRVVITGLGVVAPNGIGKDAFWQNLIAGKSAVDYINSFDASSYPCQVAGEVSDFHPTDFMVARKAKTMGRFSQLAIAAGRLAIDDAALSITDPLAPKTTVCFGNSANGVGDIAAETIETLRVQGPKSVKPWAALDFPPHAAASYLSIEFGIKGRSISISSNCCTGLDVIGTAASQIADGNALVALAGSSEAPIFPASFSAFCALGALTKRNDEPRRASRPYDLHRDGAVLSEGAFALILEDLEFAVDRGANVYAEILGYGAASEAIGMRKGDISGHIMANAIQTAIRVAGLYPSDLDHINAHGSSLPDYDVCDTNAFKIALGAHAYRIPITSIKSMIGQPVSAAGGLQTAAACLAIHNHVVAPTINQEFADPDCDLDYVPNVSRVARVNRALINAHSYGGSVSALVIGKAIF